MYTVQIIYLYVNAKMITVEPFQEWGEGGIREQWRW
jgi:hypothetical protein